jgi:catechol 2,3-dioxygenase-like lactoylglutathione lyase family enzyme
MMQSQIGLITIFVRNLERATHFYTEVIGLPLVEDLTVGPFAVLKPTIGPLIIMEFDPTMFTPGADPVGFELSVFVDDFDGVWARWQAYGTAVLARPHQLPLGRSFVGKGPEGHRIRINELTEGLSFAREEGYERTLADLREELDHLIAARNKNG